MQLVLQAAIGRLRRCQRSRSRSIFFTQGSRFCSSSCSSLSSLTQRERALLRRALQGELRLF